jgi:tetratricopeptide (TPR) repeat protein
MSYFLCLNLALIYNIGNRPCRRNLLYLPPASQFHTLYVFFSLSLGTQFLKHGLYQKAEFYYRQALPLLNSPKLPMLSPFLTTDIYIGLASVLFLQDRPIQDFLPFLQKAQVADIPLPYFLKDFIKQVAIQAPLCE